MTWLRNDRPFFSMAAQNPAFGAFAPRATEWQNQASGGATKLANAFRMYDNALGFVEMAAVVAANSRNRGRKSIGICGKWLLTNEPWRI